MLDDYTFIIIHGSYGSPKENWFPRLAKKLKEAHAHVELPAFPTPEGQNLVNWLDIFNKAFPKLTDRTVLIGHSLGAPFILRILEHSPSSVRAAFLVSGFTGLLNNPEFDNVNASFVEGGFDWAKIRANCKTFHVYNSDNDPYVPLKFGHEIAEKSGGKLTVIHNGGHINAAAGFIEFEQLFKDIKADLA